MSFSDLKNKLIGDRAFYRKVLAVAIPMMIQNGVTNLVSLVDNIMVGAVGTEAMSGVSIVNQFLFIFNLLIFGAVSAAGIFTAQYHGKGDLEGVRHTFRFKFVIGIIAGAIATVVFALCSELLINSFLHESSSEGDLALTMSLAKEYLFVMIIGLIPYAISQVYASTMRETGDAKLPMIASTCAVLVNLVLNGILIFGLIGFPAMGARGAAIATVISRFVELGVLIVAAHKKGDKYPFAKHAYRTLIIPRALAVRIILKGLPIMLNELLWAAAMTARNSCYATRGLDVVAGLNISMTVNQLFSVVYMSLGSAIAIIVGNLLGAGKISQAKDEARKMLVFSLGASLVMGVLLAAISPVFPLIYNTSDEVRSIATYAILVMACVMPLQSLAHSAYFTIRSGGKVLITMLSDSVFVWAVAFPLAFCLSNFTNMSFHLLYLLCQGAEVIKVVFGITLLNKVDWAHQIVLNED